MRMLDLFCGRWGWSKAFAARGWECVGVDLVEPPEIPQGCTFVQGDILNMGISPKDSRFWYGNFSTIGPFDFICASSPCEQFSVHGMKNFHPNPPYPELGIKLFNHTREICEASGVPYVMENVRAAQQFVGHAVHHCGPFYLWGNAVPPLLNQGIQKGIRLGTGGFTGKGQKFATASPEERRIARKLDPMISAGSKSTARQIATAMVATIPPELANCVADYAERLLEQRSHEQSATL